MDKTGTQDTICLLRECNAGSKMAVSSIDDVLDKVKDTSMGKLLSESKSHHEKLCDDIHALLRQHHSEEKEPGSMAKGMAWLKTTMKLGMEESDATVADLMTDGCNMGIKTLHKYLNQYPAADHSSKDICNRLIDIEEQLCRDLKSYL